MSMVFDRWKVDALECQDHDHSPSGESLFLQSPDVTVKSVSEHEFRVYFCTSRSQGICCIIQPVNRIGRARLMSIPSPLHHWVG